MGACYSKQPTLDNSAKGGKAPKLKPKRCSVKDSSNANKSKEECALLAKVEVKGHKGLGSVPLTQESDKQGGATAEQRATVDSSNGPNLNKPSVPNHQPGISSGPAPGSCPPQRRASNDVVVVSSSTHLSVVDANSVTYRTSQSVDDKIGSSNSTSCRVAPSDSGIESIGTAPEDVLLVDNSNSSSSTSPLTSETSPVTFETKGEVNRMSDFSKRLQRLSRGSCYKCGNFKLDDSALTALLTNTYCLCGPRQVGKATANPKCQTHRQRSNSNKENVEANNSCLDDSFSSEDTSRAEKTLLGNRVAGFRGAGSQMNGNHSNTSDSFSTKVDIGVNSSGDNKKIKNIDAIDSDGPAAPLAHFDSIDCILTGSPSPSLSNLSSRSKRRSLLSEILDLTDSICKCDFYSNEYCCISEKDRGSNQTMCHHKVRKNINNEGLVQTCNINFVVQNSTGESHLPMQGGLMDVSIESEASDVTLVKSSDVEDDDHDDDDIDNRVGLAKSLPSSPTKSTVWMTPKKTTSLTKYVSFAHEKVVEDIMDTTTHADPSSCHSLNMLGYQDSISLSKDVSASSGVFTHSGSVSLTQLLPLKGRQAINHGTTAFWVTMIHVYTCSFNQSTYFFSS